MGSRINVTINFNFSSDEIRIPGSTIKLNSSIPDASYFDPQNQAYDRKKWEEFLLYDLSQEFKSHLEEYLKPEIESFLNEAELHNKKLSKKNKNGGNKKS